MASHPASASNLAGGTSSDTAASAMSRNIARSATSSPGEGSLWSTGERQSVATGSASLASDGLALGSIPLQPGELQAAEYERPTSAPPPGFVMDHDDRNKRAEEAIWGSAGTNHSSGAGAVGDDGGYRSSSSFSNLAAVLGAGLAESMESATKEGDGGVSAVSSLFNQKDDLNFHRQTRHAASRLVGASSPPKNESTFQQQAPGGSVPSGLFGDSASYSGGHTGSSTENRGSGFPSSLSTPQRTNSTDNVLQRTGASVAGSNKVGDRTVASTSKDIGMNVVEPDGDNRFNNLSGVVSRRIDASTTSPGFDHMWSPNAPEFKPSSSQADNNDGNSSVTDSLGGGAEVSAGQAENELKPFLWDSSRNAPSRTLAILRVSWLRPPEIRSACEAYGVLDSFRTDFANKGIFFVSYFDIRSAQYAATELQTVLQRLLILQRSSDEALVRYCLPLNSSSQFDDSQISISDLPPHVDENVIVGMMSSYGAIRSVFRQGVGSYLVEFQSIQDAKQALLELESSLPWGPSVAVEMGGRNPVERKRGRELLAMISRWRRGSTRQSSASQMSGSGSAAYSGSASAGMGGMNDNWRGQDGLPPNQAMHGSVDMGGMGGYGGGGPSGHRAGGTPQLVLGPDGRYQVVMQNAAMPYGHHGPQGLDQRQPQQQMQQQIIQGPNGQLFVTSAPMPHGSNMFMPQQATPLRVTQGGLPIVTNQAFMDAGAHAVTPYYTHIIAAQDAGSVSVASGRSYRSNQSANDDRDNRHLMLDLDNVESGRDTRTSLMVRNIPNKYTQQMLLAEFEENGHGPGVIDFFYLPIDFKNRCNRGYAFINFVDFKDILPFHRRYFGKHWRTFNSDKICDITYARIQGKAAMLKRFENSALMEKDDEYKPLVFVSDGPNKGQRMPFPGPPAK